MFSYEDERMSHERLCSLGIPVGTKVLCHYCNAHFANFAYLSALRHEQFCAHNPTNRADNGLACHVPNIPRMHTTAELAGVGH